jgi:hypothetical protein
MLNGLTVRKNNRFVNSFLLTCPAGRHYEKEREKAAGK